MDGEFLQKYRQRRDRKESYEKRKRGYLSVFGVFMCVCVLQVREPVTEKQAKTCAHTHTLFLKVETFLSAPSLTEYG